MEKIQLERPDNLVNKIDRLAENSKGNVTEITENKNDKRQEGRPRIRIHFRQKRKSNHQTIQYHNLFHKILHQFQYLRMALVCSANFSSLASYLALYVPYLPARVSFGLVVMFGTTIAIGAQADYQAPHWRQTLLIVSAVLFIYVSIAKIRER